MFASRLIITTFKEALMRWLEFYFPMADEISTTENNKDQLSANYECVIGVNMKTLPQSQPQEYFIMMQVMRRPPVQVGGPYAHAGIAMLESSSRASDEVDQTVRYFVESRDKN